MTHALSWQSSLIREHLLRKESQTRVVTESLRFLHFKHKKLSDQKKKKTQTNTQKPSNNPWPLHCPTPPWLSSHLWLSEQEGETRLEICPSLSLDHHSPGPLCLGMYLAQLPPDSGGEDSLSGGLPREITRSSRTLSGRASSLLWAETLKCAEFPLCTCFSHCFLPFSIPTLSFQFLGPSSVPRHFPHTF